MNPPSASAPVASLDTAEVNCETNAPETGAKNESLAAAEQPMTESKVAQVSKDEPIPPVEKTQSSSPKALPKCEDQNGAENAMETETAPTDAASQPVTKETEPKEEEVTEPQPVATSPAMRKHESVTKETEPMEEEVAEPQEPVSMSPAKPKHPHVGKQVEWPKILPSGHYMPLAGTVVDYQEPRGRIPPRWRVNWETTDSVVMADEWTKEDIEDELGAPPRSWALEHIMQQRYNERIEEALAANQIAGKLLLYAALEEVLQANLQQQNDSSTAPTKKRKGQDPHPPLYYAQNPSSYLQAPSADLNGGRRSTNMGTVVTPASLAQRVRTGSQWAFKLLDAQRPTPSAPPILPTVLSSAAASSVGVVQRRSTRQPKPVISNLSNGNGNSTVAHPTPVQKGGRVCQWWLDALKEAAERKDGVDEPKSNVMPDIEEVEAQDESLPPAPKPKPKKKVKTPKKKKPTEEIDDEAMAQIIADEDSVSEKGDDDEDYSAAGNDDDAAEDDDEELEDVEREGKDTLYFSADEEAKEGDDGSQDEVEEESDSEIVLESSYLTPEFPAFLEYLSKAKSMSADDVKNALMESIVRIRFNKRTATMGLETQKDLSSVDKIALGQELPEAPEGEGSKVVLVSAAGETFGELMKLDAQTFQRCKLSLEVLGEQEKTQQIRKKEELFMQEAAFKDQRNWEKYRYKSIHEGYTHWPNWQDSITEWVRNNVTMASVDESTSNVETNVEASLGNTADSSAKDEALAKSLEENDQAQSGGRRRTARRAATSAAEGVFYGSQSGMTHKQLMEALIRLVKANGFQTLIRLQEMVGDDSNDPIRRSRAGLGKLLWKRNQIARKEVTTELSDKKCMNNILGQPLTNLHLETPVDTAPSEPNAEEKQLLAYIQQLHHTELQLRRMVLENLTNIPVAIVATAADERPGSMEAMDDVHFHEGAEGLNWMVTGHDFVGKTIYRPESTSSTNDLSECFWYTIQDFTESVDSKAEEKEDVDSKERRMRFRAVPAPAPGETYWYNTLTLVLTEAQVHAGLKAMSIQQEQSGAPNSTNPFSGGIGDKVTLVPLDEDEGVANKELQGAIVAFDSIVNQGEDAVEHKILVLPDQSEKSGEAFWAVLDVRADDSSYICQPTENSTIWYSIEQFDFHAGSQAYNECQNVVDWLKRQSKASAFLVPVDPVALNIPQYLEIIKNPMDISTVADKLENGMYSSIPPGQKVGSSPSARMLNGPFKKDVVLVFDNALTFNPPGEWIYQVAQQLKKQVLKKIADLSSAADQKKGGTGRFRQRQSVYVDEDSDMDMYEYESDQDEEFDGNSRRNKKRKRVRRAKKHDDFAARAIEHPIRLQSMLRDANDLKGAFGQMPINTAAASFSLSAEWGCRSATSILENTNDAEDGVERQSTEMAELLSLQKSVIDNESSGLRRSTRAGPPGNNTGVSAKKKNTDGIEYFLKDGKPGEHVAQFPRSRLDVEILREKLHEDHYASLYLALSKMMVSETYGGFFNGSFPPYLGRVVPVSAKSEVSWEIQSEFVAPALRWLLRGLINSGHLTALEPMTNDTSSGLIITNDIYYCDAALKPYEVLDVRELQRKKRSLKPDDEDSEDDVEMSEYEKARAERVARNAERLKALGLT